MMQRVVCCKSRPGKKKNPAAPVITGRAGLLFWESKTEIGDGVFPADILYQLAQQPHIAGVLAVLHQSSQLVAQDAAEVFMAGKGYKAAGVG